MTAIVSQDHVSATTVDGLSLWESESQTKPSSLSLVRLDGNERLLVPFTSLMTRVEVHYSDASSLQGYIRCNGPDCVLCRVGLQKDVRDLWPVYDLIEKIVCILPITTNMRPQTLRPQLLPILRQLKESKDRLLLSVRQERPKIFVSTSTLHQDVDCDAEQIKQFSDKLAAGEINLASVYPKYANEELCSIPEISTRLLAKGIKSA